MPATGTATLLVSAASRHAWEHSHAGKAIHLATSVDQIVLEAGAFSQRKMGVGDPTGHHKVR